ncbi:MULTISPECIES: hypothetical protein [unclassified Sphingomonas]|uniref:hypothetical protein n=1 Tax=unclassified Sphingomonas TaxID=196159 RepID=UPI00138F7AB9|nr:MULTISPECIES: hypothetical protein [unclassified Sphingomonas]
MRAEYRNACSHTMRNFAPDAIAGLSDCYFMMVSQLLVWIRDIVLRAAGDPAFSPPSGGT